MPHGYLKHAPKGDVSRRAMRGGSSGKSRGDAGRKRLKETKLGGDGSKSGSRGHGGKGRSRHELNDLDYSDLDYVQPRTKRVASTATVLVAGSRVNFAAAPGVVIGATVSSVNASDYTIEIFVDGVSIPGVRREQLSFSPVAFCPAPPSGIGSAAAPQPPAEYEADEDFVLVGAPLPRAESVGAPLPRMESDDEGLASLTTLQSIEDLAALATDDAIDAVPFEMSWATKLCYKGPGGTPRPPPSFQSVQAEEQAKSSYNTRADVDEMRPNALVVQDLVSMGFESEISSQASLATGNESVEAAARWLVDNLEEHEQARKAIERQSKAVGFVDKVIEALRPSTEQGDDEDSEWNIVEPSEITTQ